MQSPPGGRWRVALIDSCGVRPGAIAGAAFLAEGGAVVQRPALADPTGHGTRIAQLLERAAPSGPEAPHGESPRAAGRFELLLGQVFVDARPASAAAVAAAVDWAVGHAASLVHLSLGLTADRDVLRAAVERAIRAGCVIVAASPARGPRVYPGAYPQVIRGTGDARCAPGELSCLQPGLFGACPRLAAVGAAASGVSAAAGASIGAARVTRAILEMPPAGASAVVTYLAARSTHRGPERRTAHP